jgi:hypothetical protein
MNQRPRETSHAAAHAATYTIGYEAVWRSSSSKLHLIRADTQFLHDGSNLSHLFFLLWQREHEARALAGAGDGVAGTTPAAALSGIGQESQRRDKCAGARERHSANIFQHLSNPLAVGSARLQMEYLVLICSRLPPFPRIQFGTIPSGTGDLPPTHKKGR